jgi:transcriptional regulator with XRE-family HTH domain
MTTDRTQTTTDARRLDTDASRTVAMRVREELARKRWSRQRLADAARISISTLEKALSGRRPFTLATTIRVEEALGIDLRSRGNGAAHAHVAPTVSAPGVAPDELGNYARPAVSWIEGTYLTLRPSFDEPGAIDAYRTEIGWDDGTATLWFRDSEPMDAALTQFGSVAMPQQSGHIYLVTNWHGHYRLIILARPTIAGEMFGILTTLQGGRGAQQTPVATPIALIPMAGRGAAAPSDIAFGRIGAGHQCFAAYRRLLHRAIDEPFAMLLPP